MGRMLAGQATKDGTSRYVQRFAGRAPAEHFREMPGEVRASTLGLGTYLGREDDVTDSLYRKAVTRALAAGVNVLDTAVNYRHQRSERAIGAALAAGAAFLDRLREAFTALEGAVRDGKIRLYGAATWNGLRADPGERGYLSLAELVGVAREVAGAAHHFRVIQLPYNLAMPEAFTRANQKLDGGFFSTLDAARHLGLYVMASASVLQGKLTQSLPAQFADLAPGPSTDAQRAIQFVRSTPGVGTALVGMKSTAHVDENAGVAAVPPLGDEQVRRLFSEG